MNTAASPSSAKSQRAFAIIEMMFLARKLLQDGRLSAADMDAITELLSAYLNGGEAPGD